MFVRRDYTAREILADGVIHGFAIAGSIAAAGYFLPQAAASLEGNLIVALVVYMATMIVMFCCSMAYNIIPHKPVKPLLRRFDQAAIFLKIAGTYTPLTVMIGSFFSHVMLAMVWLAALAGVALKMFGQMHRDTYTIPLYLGLGWASLLLAWPIVKTLPTEDAVLILVGGLLYSAGLIFHVREDMEFSNAIWHVFVAMAAGCHFIALSHASFSLGI